MDAFIAYQGPSMIDGKPIVLIVNRIDSASDNGKTGAMVQSFILRADIEPHTALKTGDDVSVCGDCIHRPANGGSCYVRVFQAPLSVYRAFKRGSYVALDTKAGRAVLAGKRVRLGTYGDPAAVPFEVWAELVADADAITGYSHQWRTCDQRFATLCMASADSDADRAEAWLMGWRSFRVRTENQPIAKGEFVCPASDEAGKKTNCAACRACGGLSSKAKASPVIIAHGATAKRFKAA